MTQMEKAYFEKRGQILVKNLQNRHFDAWYCDTKEDALAKVLELIPEGAKIGWGGVLSAQQIGLFDALRAGNYNLLDRDLCQTQEEREQMMKDALFSDVFLTGANGLSLDGQMVNIDGTGNRVGAIIYGPKKVIVIAGMNKVCDTLEIMQRHAAVMAPKFEAVLEILDTQLADLGIASWLKPRGGYFVSLDAMPGTAKRTLELCAQAGVVMTPAGATYPYGIDPADSNIRIAPSFPPVEELRQAMEIFCLCLKLAACEKLLKEKENVS